MLAKALTIAGSDSGGGAGIQADLKTFAALDVYGMSAITAITAQNTCGVSAVQGIDPEIVAAQIRAVVTDIGVGAAKTGMLFSAEIIQAVARPSEPGISSRWWWTRSWSPRVATDCCNMRPKRVCARISCRWRLW